MSDATSTYLVTGGTSGLGLECARALAATPGARVVVTGRTLERTAEVAAGLGAHPMRLDLASLASVHRFADELAAELAAGGLPPLRGLVCNAGLQVHGESRTEDGFETTFGVNHLGHLALVEQLVDLFQAPARIVLVASGTHDPAKPTGTPSPLADAGADELAFPPASPDESPARAGLRRYATSKLAGVRTSYVLSRRLAGRSIAVNAFDPGLMPGTGLARDAGPVARLLWRTVARALVALPPVHTSRTSGTNLARLLTAPELAGVSGAYFVGRRPAGSSLASYQVEAGEALYRDSLRLIGAASSGVGSEAAPLDDPERPDTSVRG
ncbi:MAG TPA: SDR family NAD(P)-dependent oxidoreductase [Pseudonocardia sp.]|nr:SDR family NAD(P)-dependent oxidoreductase [Pseudonocardia sp.]